MSLLYPSFDQAVELWVKTFKKQPVATVISSLLMVAIIFTTVYFVDRKDRTRRETERLQSLDFSAQLEQLEQTEKAMRQLISFVAYQKTSLHETQSTLLALKLEREKLRPLIESDRSTVEAILSAQEQRSSSNVWRERIFGFGIGVLASLLASFIWAVGARLRRGTSAKV